MGSLVQQTNVPALHESSTREGLLAGVSVIIPVGPSEQAWRSLLLDLTDLAAEAELFFVATDPEPADLSAQVATCGLRCRMRWITTTPGRAQQMNCGAEGATRFHLWFLHADSRVSPAGLVALERSLEVAPAALHYFDLTFQDDGPWLTCSNAWGVRFRSRYLGLPFGDQGFCVSREQFLQLGGFNEHAAYGEDHLLVWSARRQGVPIRCVGESIATSARKYEAQGWLRTTLRNAWLTWRQAAGEWWKCAWSHSA
jgi:rSAM/selenodomain-associated transferase 2